MGVNVAWSCVERVSLKNHSEVIPYEISSGEHEIGHHESTGHDFIIFMMNTFVEFMAHEIDVNSMISWTPPT